MAKLELTNEKVKIFLDGASSFNHFIVLKYISENLKKDKELKQFLISYFKEDKHTMYNNSYSVDNGVKYLKIRKRINGW